MSPNELDALEVELRAVATVRDPVPDEVVTAALAAFEVRSLDAELASLTYDSFLDEALAGVRGAGGARQLTFEGTDVVVDIQIDFGEEPRVAGQLTPPQAGALEVRHSSGTIEATVDASGRFVISPPPPGPFSISFLRYANRRRLATAWIAV